jgi:hypothetical protein
MESISEFSTDSVELLFFMNRDMEVPSELTSKEKEEKGGQQALFARLHADYVSVSGSAAPLLDAERRVLARRNTSVTLKTKVKLPALSPVPRFAGCFAGFQIGTGACILKGTLVTPDNRHLLVDRVSCIRCLRVFRS